LVYSANEEHIVHSSRARKFDGRNSLNSGAGWVANSAALVDVGTLGAANDGFHSAIAQRESSIVSDEEPAVTEKWSKGLQEGLMAFFEQEDPRRLGVIEYSKVSVSLNSPYFRLTIVFLSTGRLSPTILTKAGLALMNV
jgi:hypothetical protein